MNVFGVGGSGEGVGQLRDSRGNVALGCGEYFGSSTMFFDMLLLLHSGFQLQCIEHNSDVAHRRRCVCGVVFQCLIVFKPQS